MVCPPGVVKTLNGCETFSSVSKMAISTSLELGKSVLTV
jgi:hypothetical protein